MSMLILIDLLVELVVWQHVNIKITIMIYLLINRVDS